MRKNVRILASFVYVLCIAVVVFVSIRFFSRRDSTFGILFSTTLSCFLMVPIVHNMELVARARQDREDSEAERLVRSLQRENALLQEEKDAMLRRLHVLEGTSFAAPRYSDVCKLGFKTVTAEGTFVRRERLDRADVEFLEHPFKYAAAHSERHYDEVLSAFSYSVTALCGIDLQKLRVTKLSDREVLVRGLRAEFVAEPAVRFEPVIAELRHVTEHRSGRQPRIAVDTSADARLAVRERQDAYQKEFEAEFRRLELEKAAAQVESRAKEFLSRMLSPWFTVRADSFEDELAPAASQAGRTELPLADFLAAEAAGWQERLNSTEEGRAFLKGIAAPLQGDTET